MAAGRSAGSPAMVAVGIDTHGDMHLAAVIDFVGRRLGHGEFAATPGGYTELWKWVQGSGAIQVVGIEGTGAYGAGVCNFLLARGVHVVEVDRPDRKTRRFKGKSDPLDAYSAARAAVNGSATTLPKSHDGEMVYGAYPRTRGGNRVRTTMVYTHVLDRGGLGVRSPLDG